MPDNSFLNNVVRDLTTPLVTSQRLKDEALKSFDDLLVAKLIGDVIELVEKLEKLKHPTWASVVEAKELATNGDVEALAELRDSLAAKLHCQRRDWWDGLPGLIVVFGSIGALSFAAWLATRLGF